MKYILKEQPNPKMAVLQGAYGLRIWSLGRARKDVRCRITEKVIAKGELCWRPITNDMNRYHRISTAGMRRLAGIAKRSKQQRYVGESNG